jgi:hypothetical protein
MNIVYIHIGKNVPNYTFDSIFQALLINNRASIVLLVNNECAQETIQEIKNLDIDYSRVQVISLESIPANIPEFPDYVKNFRNSFWTNTINRFFYIEGYMKQYKKECIFHIENDVMIYDNLENLVETAQDKLWLAKDSEKRVIPSIVYLGNLECISNLNNWMLQELQKEFRNDMDLLGSYKNQNVCYFDLTMDTNNKYIVDGAAIGQYLGGVDPKNIGYEGYSNPSVGFINETSDFKPNSVTIFKKNVYVSTITNKALSLYFSKNNKCLKQIINLHIHSKELVPFSSKCDINYNDLITGERILSLCDFTLITREILEYHKNIQHYTENFQKLLLVNDFQNVKIHLLNKYIKSLSKDVVSLHIYTHILEPFTYFIWPYLDDSIKYTLYLHNSDHELTESLFKKLQHDKLNKIYAQNITFYHEKIFLLPIGIANSMFSHGNLDTVYSVLKKSYKQKKTKNIYININPSTYYYRKILLDKIISSKAFQIASSKPYEKYLEDLSEHYFCLCVRGNGIQCHREWESLYMSTIPVIVRNEYTNAEAYIRYLKDLEIPHYVVDYIENFDESFFNKELYTQILSKYPKYFLNTYSLKISYYV